MKEDSRHAASSSVARLENCRPTLPLWIIKGLSVIPCRIEAKSCSHCQANIRVKHFGHSMQWRTREAMVCVGELLQALPTCSCVNNLGHDDIRVTQVVPAHLRPCAFAQRMAGMHGAEAPKICLYRSKWAGSESPQRVVAGIRGQDWIAGVYVRNLPSTCRSLAFTGVKRREWMSPACGPRDHRCHTRDLSALIDIAGRDYEEVGISGN